jgi:hypothetical protein
MPVRIDNSLTLILSTMIICMLSNAIIYFTKGFMADRIQPTELAPEIADAITASVVDVLTEHWYPEGAFAGQMVVREPEASALARDVLGRVRRRLAAACP